ncbi:MAG: DUF1016 N-terminal domain-containing protein [Methanoregula sp.]
MDPNLPFEVTADYTSFIGELKDRIRAAQIKAVLSANRELITLYWSTGRDVFNKQKNDGWGSKIVNRLASDLHREFPDMEGFSRTNIYRMRAIYQAYPENSPIVPQPVGQKGRFLGADSRPRAGYRHTVFSSDRPKGG